MSVDVRTAAFRALAAKLRELTWDNAGALGRFAEVESDEQVFETWSDPETELKLPAIAIAQIDAPIDYTGTTKSIAFEVVKGSGGTIVFKVGEWVCAAELQVWAESAPQIDAIVRALQDALNPEEARLGLFIPLGDAYFQQIARVMYDEDRTDMNVERARRNERRTIVPLTIEVPYCQEATRPVMRPETDLAVEAA